jgi:ferredoxin
MNISIDGTLCQGHGLCNMSAPEVFALDDNGHSCVESPDIPADERLRARVLAAAAACPERAISIRE